ncbi:MAG: hypothetical protein MUE90_10915 [Thermoanaerobaculales bacterium]|jgi:hypothetical protein|nr:hypothetical protein [Thermoanaerobaculales bacterium]
MGTRSFTSSGLILVAASLAAVLAGCGPPTVDPTSYLTLERSVSKLRGPMEESQRGRFEEALQYLVGEAAVIPEDIKNSPEPEHPEIVLALYRPLKGLTADGVIAEARRQRLEQVQGAVTELEALRAGSEATRGPLADFDLRASRVFKRNRGFLEWPVIEFQAANNTDQTVWLIHFRAALLRPGYDEPWLVEDFDQLVLDGLAPEARDMWRIEPQQQEWVTLIDPHPDFVFTLEVMRLEGLGATVIAATEFGQVEAARLALYRQTLDRIHESDTLALDGHPRPGTRAPKTPAGEGDGASG